jgi:hypothetical protein
MQPCSRRIGPSIDFTVLRTSFRFSTGTVILIVASIKVDLLAMAINCHFSNQWQYTTFYIPGAFIS